jgi:hypothetical protein
LQRWLRQVSFIFIQQNFFDRKYLTIVFDILKVTGHYLSGAEG